MDRHWLTIPEQHKLLSGNTGKLISMSTIDICALHSMPREEAQQAADQLAGDLAAKFAIDYGWDEDTIHFERPGVAGHITIDEEKIHIQAQLGFLLMILKGRIEQEIENYLETHFGCSIKHGAGSG